MAKVTLARFLKYKNRVVERMRKLERDIQSGNSVVEGALRDTDVNVAWEERLALEVHLVELKGIQDKTNDPIKNTIAKIQELKGRIKFLGTIPTLHGVQDSHRTLYGEQGTVTYEAVIRKQQIDTLLSAAQEEIDALQDNIDLFNNTTHIELKMLPLK